MKICMLATGYPRYSGDVSSAKNYLRDLAEILVREGVEVHVIAPHAEGLKKEDSINGVFIHRFQYLCPARFQSLAYNSGIPEKIKTFKGKLQMIPFILAMLKELIYIVKKYDIDIINAHWAIPPGFVATITKRIHKKPVILKLYGAELFPIFKNESLINKIAKRAISYSIHNANKVIANSIATSDTGKKISGRNDIEAIFEGIDIRVFSPNANASIIQEKYNLNKYHLILSTGRMVERKGFKYLLEAVPYVLEMYPNSKFFLGGEGPEKRNLISLVETLGIEDNVVFTGFIPDKDFPNYLKACDVFVLPSIVDSNGDTEGFGLVLVEAMGCGTPVVGSNVGGIPSIIKNGYNGFLVPEKSPKELADRIIELLSDEKLVKEFEENGLRTVREKFSWEHISKKYLYFFYELLR